MSAAWRLSWLDGRLAMLLRKRKLPVVHDEEDEEIIHGSRSNNNSNNSGGSSSGCSNEALKGVLDEVIHCLVQGWKATGRVEVEGCHEKDKAVIQEQVQWKLIKNKKESSGLVGGSLRDVYSCDAPIRLFYGFKDCFNGDVSMDDVVEAFVFEWFRAFSQRTDLNKQYDVVEVVKSERCSGHVEIKVVERGVLMQSLSHTVEPHLKILYKDDFILVVDKPHDFLSVPGKDSANENVYSLVRRCYPEARMVHRLDYETSGVMVIALTRKVAQVLNQQFREQEPHKIYTAICLGKFASLKGIITEAIGLQPNTSLVQIIDNKNGRASKTVYSVSKYDSLRDQTRVELVPHTGRTHQLRVHLNYIGHTILGDSIYGKQTSTPTEQQAMVCNRLHLHATKLTITHPESNAPLHFTSLCPF